MKALRENVSDEAIFKEGSFSLFWSSPKQTLGSERKCLSSLTSCWTLASPLYCYLGVNVKDRPLLKHFREHISVVVGKAIRVTINFYKV